MNSVVLMFSLLVSVWLFVLAVFAVVWAVRAVAYAEAVVIITNGWLVVQYCRCHIGIFLCICHTKWYLCAPDTWQQRVWAVSVSQQCSEGLWSTVRLGPPVLSANVLLLSARRHVAPTLYLCAVTHIHTQFPPTDSSRLYQRSSSYCIAQRNLTLLALRRAAECFHN